MTIDEPKKRGRPPLNVVVPAAPEADDRTLRVKMLRGYVPANGMAGIPIPEDWPEDRLPPRKLAAGRIVDLPLKEARALIRSEAAVRADPLPGDEDD